MDKDVLTRWRANFLAGLAVVLPAVISIALLLWLFGNIAKITDTLLIFIPRRITHADDGRGPMHWYWSLFALVLAVFLIGLVGLAARNYFGKKIIQWVDMALLRVPLLNKIYGAIKQVNEAFSTGNKTSFKTVVMIQYPRIGMYALGFITSEQHAEIQLRTKEKIVSVFVPTTPNPTSGFLVLVPESQLTRLDMSVADGIKFIISLGSISPEYVPPPQLRGLPPVTQPSPEPTALAHND